ncbi:MAG: HupE/UreJ family protein [Candidatus Binatia bacterium]
MRADARRPLALALVLVALGARSVGAHALSPALLMLQEDAAGGVAVTWKIPTLRLIGAELRPILPAECPVTQREEISEGDDSVTTRWHIDCGSQGLVGRKVGVDGLAAAKTDALVRLELADGRAVDTVLRAREPELVIPAHEAGLGLASRYVTLGVEHILTGYDHLLFVFGLLLLASGARALVATISAFTLGHSVTLTLAVFDIARVPSGPVEALIAFSIFVLAVELARGDHTSAPTLMRRRPWLMALAFGFLHGLGFAGTLRAAGLPPHAIPLALFGFNVGIELGQLAFVVAVLALTALARPALRRLPTWTCALPVYAMGSLAACWTIQRAIPLLR